MRSTERRPDLYKICPDVFGEYKDVLAIEDRRMRGDKVLQFGEIQELTSSWLWDYRGQLLVIATPFHDGVHYATLPGHFIPIIEHLEQMHQNGFVHGDIRAFNMVLEYKNEDPKQETEESTHLGWLIDFDFGGYVGTELKGESNLQQSCGYLKPKYPSGYVHNLDDGFRLGRAGDAITKSHDWYAVGHIIFVLHELVHPEYDVINICLSKLPFNDEQRRIEENETRLSRLQKMFSAVNGDYSKLLNQSGELQQPADFLREYLLEAKKYEFQLVPTKQFETVLQDCNMYKSEKPRNDSKGATGSPQKEL